MATVISVTPPYVVFPDADGNSLEDGYIYVGTAGTNPLIDTNQIQLYVDSALTIPMAQPVRTNGGYPIGNGSPVKIYSGVSDYSILVQDKHGELIHSSPSNKTKFGLIDLSTDVTGLLGSEFVKYKQTTYEASKGVVPVNEFVPSHDRVGYAIPERYGSVGDGVTNDMASFATMFSLNLPCKFTPTKNYFLGLVTSNTQIFTFTGVNNIIIDWNGAKITVQTSGGNYNAPLFQIDNVDGFTLIAPEVEDLGYDYTVDFKGITFVRLKPVTGPIRNVRLTRVKLKSLVAPIDCTSAANLATGIWFDGDCYSTYYGISLTSNGHNLTADYRTYDVIRSYFCAGVQNHEVNCVSTNHNSRGNADFLLKVYQTTYPTRNIRARFTSINSQSEPNPQLVFESQNDAGTLVTEDIEIHYNDVQSPAITNSIAFRHYNNSSVLQATDPNTKNRIRVRGYARGNIVYSSVPTTYQDQNFDECLGQIPSFSAYKSAVSSNVTGDGTNVDIIFDTELHDFGGNWYSTGSGIFTAPRDGIYTFQASALITGITTAESRGDIRLVTTPKTFSRTCTNTSNPTAPEMFLDIAVARVYLRSGETAKVQIMLSGGTKIADLYGDSTIIATQFSGGLVRGGPKSP